MTTLYTEVGSTVRAAICGWAPTVRLISIIIAVTICLIVITSI